MALTDDVGSHDYHDHYPEAMVSPKVTTSTRARQSMPIRLLFALPTNGLTTA
jgi:hypothetical protein